MNANVFPGSVHYVPAGVTHDFTNVAEELTLFVLFAKSSVAE